MSKPQVTLTLAGDESKLDKAFAAVGASSKKMADEVGASSKRVGKETSESFERTNAAAEGTYDKFDALESVGRGTTDTMSGLGEIMSGNILQGSTDLAGGVAALADGFTGALLPAIKAAAAGGLANAAATARQTAATLLSKGAAIASAAATNVMAVAQKALNLAMRANPIGLIITALTLLVAGLIYAYKHSETFRNIVNGAFHAVLGVVQAVVSWIRNNWPLLLKILTGPIGLAVGVIAKHRDSIVGFFRSVPGAIAGFFKGVASTITAPYRAAFSAIKSAWNNTVGGKGFSVPGWVPGLGGKDFRIPYFHTGGIVSGAMGSETLAVLKAGERVTGGRNSGGGVTIVLQGDGTAAGTALMEVLRKAIKVTSGGDVQVALGAR
jgi:phage-related protein